MRARILTLAKKNYEFEVKKIVVPGIDGEFCLLPHHMPITTCMKKGVLRVFTIEDGDRPLTFNVESGVCSLCDDLVTILIA